MCATVYSSLLLLIFTTIFTGTRMVTEGLPLMRQERGTDRGLLSGQDFLSIFMGSNFGRLYNEPTTTPPPEDNEHTRTTRSTLYFTTTPPRTEEYINPYSVVLDDRTTTPTSVDNEYRSHTTESTPYYITTPPSTEEYTYIGSTSTQIDAVPSSVVLGVHVSSSIGRTLIHKTPASEPIEDSTLRETTTEPTTTEFPDQNLVASEDHPSIISEVNKSEFSVEESEPITSSRQFLHNYPANVQPLPGSQIPLFKHNPDKLQPIQQTVIYHDNPREPVRARSVSYSTVIQAVPHPPLDKDWEQGEKHERRERHYEGPNTSFNNNFHQLNDRAKLNDTKRFLGEETKPQPALYKEKNWESPEQAYHSVGASSTERNWEIREKMVPQARLPTVYGQPEQNYEVDESASVMTNGRLHGVQPNPTLPTKPEQSKKTDDNQKVGYVVEGRNYRKYRVEERTSDGFIVGEYGVVSHDDGSLRGVRYTADGTISPRLIYDTLMKFLSL